MESPEPDPGASFPSCVHIPGQISAEWAGAKAGTRTEHEREISLEIKVFAEFQAGLVQTGPSVDCVLCSAHQGTRVAWLSSGGMSPGICGLNHLIWRLKISDCSSQKGL